MKRLLLLPFLLAFLPGQSARADTAIAAPAYDALCLPGAYSPAPQDCMLYGPAKHITLLEDMRRAVIEQPLMFVQIDASYGQTDNAYIKVAKGGARVYGSLNDAISNKKQDVKRTLPPGFNYLTYEDVTEIGGKKYYYIGGNEWIRAGSVIGQARPTTFRGVEVYGTPARPFGWVLYYNTTYSTPSYDSDDLSREQLDRHQLFQVFDTVTLNGYEWYLVGPGLWIEQRNVALVYPRSGPPPGVYVDRWIELNLFEQTTAVYEDGQMIYATLTTSGSAEFFTRPGLFQIYEKLTSTYMRGGEEPDGSDAYFLEGVPWTMYFDQRRAFHGEYWHDHLGFKSSHGCANLSFADAEWLYNWAELGDWVYVWDPSGLTPADESLFNPTPAP